MAIPQQLIALLNLSLPTLQQLARRTQVEAGPRRTKWDYAIALAELPQATIDNLVGEWLYAGQTSTTWIQLDEGRPLEFDRLRQALTALHGRDPFTEDIRPEDVTATPQLVDARAWTPDKVVLTFAVAKRVATVIHNFEHEDVYDDEFFLAVLRLNRGIVEVRASHERAKLLANTWLVEVDELLH